MMVRRKHDLGIRGLGQTVQTPYGPVLQAPEGSMVLYSYSLDPRVPNNPNPIYAKGSAQWLAAVASGANPDAPAYTPEQIAAMNAPPPVTVPVTPVTSPLVVPVVSTYTNSSPVSSMQTDNVSVATSVPVTDTVSSLSSVPVYVWLIGAAAALYAFSSKG